MSNLKNIHWHLSKDELPSILGTKYEHDNYPEIPCLVKDESDDFRIVLWNTVEECWDDMYGDYFGEADSNECAYWEYLDDIDYVLNEGGFFNSLATSIKKSLDSSAKEK